MSESSSGAAARELRSTARGSALNLGGYIFSGILGFALVVVVTRNYGRQGAGVFFASVAIFTILSNISELGADTGLVRFSSRLRELGQNADLRRVTLAALVPVAVMGVIAGSAMFFGAGWLGHVFVRNEESQAATFIRLIAPFLVFATVSHVALSGTRGFGTMVPFVAIESIGKPALKPAAILVLAVGGLGAADVALAWALPEALGCIAAVAILLSLLSKAEGTADPKNRRSLLEVGAEFWRFSIARGLAAAFQITVIWVDLLLLGFFKTPAEVGVYGAASRIVTVGTFALQAVRLAIAPQISALLARGDREGAQSVYQTATLWLMAVSWPMFLALAVFAPFLLKVFGEGFDQGRTALLILSLAMLVNLGTGNVTVVLLMGGKSSWNLFNTAVSLTLNIVLNLILIPRFGMEGAAAAWAVSIVADNALAVIEVRRFLGMKPFGRGYALVAGASLLTFGGSGLLVRFAFGMTLSTFIVYALVSTAVFAAVMHRYRRVLRLDILVSSLRRDGG